MVEDGVTGTVMPAADVEADVLDELALALALPFFAAEGAERLAFGPAFGAAYTKGAEYGIVAVAIGFGCDVPACVSLKVLGLAYKVISKHNTDSHVSDNQPESSSTLEHQVR